jgi:hypothetical protein
VTKSLDLQQGEVSPAVRAVEPVAGWPPYMTVPDFLASHLWPSSRSTLFLALREGKFHSFLLVDGKTRAKSRVIDVRSALQYLARLSEAAKGQGKSPLAGTSHQKISAKPVRTNRAKNRIVPKSAKH